MENKKDIYRANLDFEETFTISIANEELVKKLNRQMQGFFFFWLQASILFPSFWKCSLLAKYLFFH